MPYAVIFPGQGAAASGAGGPWCRGPAWAVVERAEAVLESPVARLVLEADADELATTRASQLAVLVTSLMAWEGLSQLVNERPVAFAGHSLGQITSLLAARAVGPEDGLRLAGRRADVTQESADASPGKMAALVGAEIDLAEQACEGIDAWVANDNAPGQVVIAGTATALDVAADRAKQLGARRAIPLAVGHAFHTPLLADAAAGLRPLLDTLPFTEPDAPVVANADAQPYTEPSVWPDQLTRHLVEPVRWRACQTTLVTELGVDTLVEIGPGSVLAGLARRTVPGTRILNVATPDDAVSAARHLATSRSSTTSPVNGSASRAAALTSPSPDKDRE